MATDNRFATVLGGDLNALLGSSGGGNSQSRGGLNALLAALSGQGAQYTRMQGERNAELAPVRGTRDAYSKPNAFADAQGAMNAQLQAALEEAMTSINRSASGAGASAGSMRALLADKAAANAASEAARLGLETSISYGNIANNSSSILEALTRGDAGGLNALVSALQLNQSGSSNRTGGSSSSRQSSNKPRAQIGASQPTASGRSGGPAVATFLPSNNQDASSFFGREGAIGSGPSGMGSVFGASAAPVNFDQLVNAVLNGGAGDDQEARRQQAWSSFKA